MVQTTSIIFMIISGLIAFGLPIAAFIVINKKLKLKIVPLLIGCAAFIIFVLILENMLHSVVLRPDVLGAIPLRVNHPVIYVLYAIFAAGIFEETARLISFTLIKNKFRGIATGFSYGIGHGGIECILFVGLSMFSNIVLSFMINSGEIASLGNMIPQDLIVDPLVNTAPAMFLVSGVERIFAFSFHVAASLLVWTAVNKKGAMWLYPVAICLHAILNIPAASMQAGLISSIALVEVLTGVLAVAVVLITIFIVKKTQDPPKITEKF